MRRILFQQTDFSSLPNPPAGFKYIGFNGPNFSEKGEDGQINQNIGGTGATGPQGATGPAGIGATDRLISSNENLQVILDNSGTLNIPLLLPISFNAVCDDIHFDDVSNFNDTNWWEFEVHFVVTQNGTVETQINNIFPILTNPGYTSGDVFIFTEEDHGIPNFNFELQLNNVTLPGGAGWTANLTVTQPPIYPSTIESSGAIKLTSNSNSLILGTDGNLNFNDGARVEDSGFYAAPGTNAVFGQYDGTTQVYTMDNGVGIQTHNDGTYSTWLFDNNGDINLPEGGDIRDSNGNSVLNANNNGNIVFEGDTLTNPSNQIINIEADNFAQLQSANTYIWVENGSGANIEVDTKVWNFDSNGDINLPEGGDIKDSNGNSVLGGGITSSTVLPYLELTNDAFIFNPYDGEVISFIKEDYATGTASVDEIDTDIAITRGTQRGIYNPHLEPEWDNDNNSGPSPQGTLWNNEGWGDLTNLNQRTYYSFYYALGGSLGNNVLAAELVMKDVANNKYYKFDFTTWGNQNNGAPVTYTRTQIDPVDGTEIGSPVTFTKAGYENPLIVNDSIDTNVTISRGNNQGIFNVALENSWTTNGYISPDGTEWNSDGWSTLKNTKQRSYDTFYNAVGGQIGNNVVGMELIMHDMINDNYYAIKFSSWTQDGNGGGFSYTRQLINTNNLFVKPDNDTDTIDIFVEDDGDGSGIGITRGSDGGIYNPYREGSWDDTVSPGGTLWNIDGWDDLSDILNRSYQTFYNAFGQGGLGNKVPGTDCVMYIPETEEYYAIRFTSWTQGGGGGFTYVRYKLDTTKLNEGLKFADGTILKSADGVGRVKHKASAGRRIEEVYGNNTVSVTSITTTNLTATASRSVVGDNRIWVDRFLSIFDDVTNNYSSYGIINLSDIQFSIDNSNWYSWNGSTSGDDNGGDTERGFGTSNSFTYNEGDTLYMRYLGGGAPQVWWDKNDLPGGSSDFRGATIDYHAFTGQATFIGTIHIVNDDGDEHITHTEVSSGSTDSENDDLWFVQNEGTISYRRMDGESKTLKIQWSAKVFYGNEYYD